MRRIGTGFVLFAALSLSCSAFETLEVVYSSPPDRSYGVPAGVSAIIEFSADVDRSDIERGFSLRTKSGAIEGTFAWESGRKFTFAPLSPIAHGSRCVMSLPRTVSDKRGNTMEKDFLSEFYVGDDLVAPRVISSDPPRVQGGLIGAPESLSRVTIRFSEPMERMAAERAFSMIPDAPGFFEWSHGDTVMTYHLTGALEYGTRYSVTVGAAARDIAGNSLAAEYRLAFIIGDEFTSPAVTGMFDAASLPPPYWERDVVETVGRSLKIAVGFTAPMDRPSSEAAFSVSPPVAGTFSWNAPGDIMTFIPSSRLDSETTYTIAIAATARDAGGRMLHESYDQQVRTCAGDSLHLSAGPVSGSNDGAAFTTLFTPPLAPWPVLIDLGDDAPGDNEYRFSFTFSRGASGPVGMDEYSVFGNITVHCFGASDESITRDVFWDSGSSRLVVVLARLAKHTLYRLTLTGGEYGLRDELGNTLERDLVFEFKDPD
jgi:hypothetical protein